MLFHTAILPKATPKPNKIDFNDVNYIVHTMSVPKNKRPKRLGHQAVFDRHYDTWQSKRSRQETGITNNLGVWAIVYSGFGKLEVTALQNHAAALANKWRAQRSSG